MGEREEGSHSVTRHACRGLLQAAKGFPPSRGTSSPSLLAARCLFPLFVNGPSHRARRFTCRTGATLNDEIFAGTAVERATGKKTGDVEGPGKENGANEAALKYCSGPLLPRLLRRFYGRVEQWRIPDVIVTVGVWGKAQEREENIERNSAWARQAPRRGLRTGAKRVCWKSWCTGDDHSPLITWTIVQGQQHRYTGEWKRIERGKERGTFARFFGSGGWQNAQKGRISVTRCCRRPRD